MNPTPARLRPALWACTALAALAAGCAAPVTLDAAAVPALRLPSADAADRLTQANYAAADRLVADPSVRRAITGLVLVTLPVGADDPDGTSRLALLTGEQIAGRLAQHGLAVRKAGPDSSAALRRASDLAAHPTLPLPGQGVQAGAPSAGAGDAVAVMATRVRGDRGVWIGLKLVRLSDGVLISAWDYLLAEDDALRDTAAAPAAPEVREVVVAPRHDNLYDAVRAYDRSRTR